MTEGARLFWGSSAGPFVAVLVVVASVMTDVTKNPMCFPAGDHRAICRVIGGVGSGVEMGRPPLVPRDVDVPKMSNQVVVDQK